jgi:hypothetical protein
MPGKLETDQVVAEPQQRRVTLEAATKLTAHFSLPIAANHVDWDILCTFGGRTEEFLTHYETCARLTEDDKFALMTMIISSFDDWLGKGGDPKPLAERLRKLLLANFATHESTVYDWCFWHLPPEIRTNPDYIFPVTPFVREIWGEVSRSLEFGASDRRRPTSTVGG